MEIKSYEAFVSTNEIDFGENIVIFLFGGSWCKPCNNLYNNLSNIENLIVYKIDVEDSDFEEYIINNNINSIPYTFVKYKDHKLEFKGEKTFEELFELFEFLKSK
jgi:thiol-disulfide isomerase/thioredoxin